MHEMLHGVGKNWATDLEPWQKNGTWVIRIPNTTPRLTVRDDVRPEYPAVAKLLAQTMAVSEDET